MNEPGPLTRQLPRRFWRGVATLGVGSLVVNLLVLVQPVYMLQMYDRVLTSASLETLAYISLAAALAIAFLGLVDALRSIMASRLALELEKAFAPPSFRACLRGSNAALGDVQPLRDLQVVRAFLAGRGVLAFLDLPFAPLFVAILLFIHPHLFWLTLVGAALLVALTLLNQSVSAASARALARAQTRSLLAAQAFTKGIEAISAMGMSGNVTDAWGREELRAVQAGRRLDEINAIFAGGARAVRIGLQVAILGYGSYLVLEDRMTAGMIFAASLISGRGLQPIDQVIGGWKGFVEVTRAWRRLQAQLVQDQAELAARTALPRPLGALTIDAAVVLPPHSDRPLLKRISFAVPAGSSTAVVGRSGAGKSTLMRVLVGAMELRSGLVRIDGADIRNWDREALGRHVGYVAQDVELYPGTIARNIARFDRMAKDDEIVSAARRAGVHDLIQQLPLGYDTMLGPGAWQLSGGQRQRIGLARALYGRPRLLVLDEPNSHLDSRGDVALGNALAEAKAEGVTVLIVTQRRSVIDAVDYILILQDGEIEQFGPREEVFRQRSPKAHAA